ncbi:hypothetical protein B0H16DRAFT_1306923 [Mycena metata]|uniref:N-acetyltransferase domain-containing protein n=1 Tax=Mycena metata TaxID=1033252 RepID=A0AAD7JRT4_9AGAR|nr:hypothetical protein B0H16DRAFT_1306923 [Mycena metata]
MPPLVGKHILISDGLEGQDDNFESLMTLWEDLQLSSFEVAAQQPSMDVISFAHAAFFFGVITRVAPTSDESKEAVPEPELPSALNPPEAWFPKSTTVQSWLEDWAESDISLPSSSTPQVQNRKAAPALKSTPVDPWLAPLRVADTPRQSAIDDAMLEDLNEWGPAIWSNNGGASSSRVGTSLTPRLAGTGDYKPSFYDTDKRPKTVENTNRAIGIIYLAVSPLSHSPHGQVGELNLGIILNKAHRGKGYAREAIQLALKYAFEVKNCHRIQASLLSLSTKDRMVSLLTQLRFGHEGTKRRSFFNPLMGEWQDVTTLAILDTDWAMRSYYKPAPKSLWDELFLRHERERDELLRWEEDNNRLKRTASMVTIRGAEAPDSEAESVASSVSTTASKGKKRMAPSASLRDSYDGSGSDVESDFGDGRFVRRFVFDDPLVGGEPSSPALSSISLVESVPGSVSSASTASSLRSPSVSGSDWDMMDSSSSHSFSDDEGSHA